MYPHTTVWIIGKNLFIVMGLLISVNLLCIHVVKRYKLYKVLVKNNRINIGSEQLIKDKILVAISTSAHRPSLGGTPILSLIRNKNLKYIVGQPMELLIIMREWEDSYIE